MTITVLLADDQALVRGGLRLIVNTQDDMHVVGEASDGHQAIELARRLRPDVVLMDIRMPHLDGLEATRQLGSDQTLGATRLLILTTFDLDAYVYEALRAGASGFLLKDAPPEQLVEAIRIVARGDALLAPSITRRLIERFLRQPVLATAGSKPLHQLTTREREVLELIAHGLSNSEIAARLYLTEATVKTHVAHIYRKLGLRDRAQAVVYAHEAGLAGIPADNEQETPSSLESN
ncbi:MAG TPA: response regulator transcription factor [Actinomycetota bacterium]|jgi:DNA-binding NarL/FixJ family response regulator|nr:response regulator transcription factor [Actinomycetota bacterium]